MAPFRARVILSRRKFEFSKAMVMGLFCVFRKSEHVHLLNCIDPHSPSRTMVTTRISSLIPGALAEFSLGLLEPDDAAGRSSCVLSILFHVSFTIGMASPRRSNSEDEASPFSQGVGDRRLPG